MDVLVKETSPEILTSCKCDFSNREKPDLQTYAWLQLSLNVLTEQNTLDTKLQDTVAFKRRTRALKYDVGVVL